MKTLRDVQRALEESPQLVIHTWSQQAGGVTNIFAMVSIDGEKVLSTRNRQSADGALEGVMQDAMRAALETL